jgi:hypothetical protein
MSGLAEHQLQKCHKIDFDGAKMLALEDRWWRRKLREEIEIEKEPRTIIKDSGAPFSWSWIPALFRATGSLTSTSPSSLGELS